MLQSIEKQQEKRKSQNAVTVMFNGRNVILSDCDSVLTRVRASLSLSGQLAEVLFGAQHSLSLSLPVTERLELRRKRGPLGPPSLSPSGKFIAEQLVERSARPAVGVQESRCGIYAAATIIRNTEQLRCVAA